MSISVACPGCKKKLKAKDELAGKQVRCPACGEPIVIPGGRAAPQSAPRQSSCGNLVEAITQGNAGEIARCFHSQDVTLIEMTDESSDDGKAALMAEVDDFPVLVALIRSFTVALSMSVVTVSPGACRPTPLGTRRI